MPIYDYECHKCGIVHDIFAHHSETVLSCEKCCGEMHRIISVNGVACFNEDAAWIGKGREQVINPNSKLPEEREFFRNPTRSNRKAYMKAAKVAEWEPGMEKVRPSDYAPRITTDELARMKMKREAIEIRSR